MLFRTLTSGLRTTIGVWTRNLSTSQSHHAEKGANVSVFNFLPSNRLPSKPRTTGLTEIRGPYYAPVTKTYLDELLGDWGEYVDGVKCAGGAFSLMPRERLSALIDTTHKHGGCYVSTGGFIEHVSSSSAGDKAVVEKYLQACKDTGCVCSPSRPFIVDSEITNVNFDVLEISSGFLSGDWASLAEQTASYGLKPKPEVGIQWGAGGDAAIEELESAGTRDPKWLIDRANTLLEAGAHMIMIESERITKNVRQWRTDVISAITSGLPKDKIMFEAAEPDGKRIFSLCYHLPIFFVMFAYHIQNQGATANLFIDHSQIVQLACLRKGIWSTGGTFARVVTFAGAQEKK
ncbi:2R-phospho-3-sulfolactate synthase [Crucibulum laeve]|uniref:2R-phospho-3-sulfolactate synthase n=1 Tax=Crucibulum laeve TaxID=68775 RepID=A0A5C3M147_9AGAR|nr:2R-phospho-3-sulfolactate synthase [Crucibulum laeve]